MIRVAAIAVLALMIGSLPIGSAEAQDSSEIFASAGEAFAAGDYGTALALFERAREAGSAGPAVHYNIAVCQFELGRYGDAQATFQFVADNFPAMRALGEYNVGLALLRQGRNSAAESHFVYARDNSDDAKVAQLADIALRRLEPSAETGRAAASSWTGLFDVTFGYDDNVALVDESTIPTGQTADSPFAELVAVISGPMSSEPGFRFDGSLYLVTYDDADEFDQSSLRIGGTYRWNAGAWRIEAGPYLNRSTLNGDGFEQRLGAGLSFRRGLNSSTLLGFRLAHDEIDEIDDRFAFVAGSREQLVISLDKYLQSGRFTFDYSLERNDRLDPGVSPSRDRLRLRYRYSISSRLRLDASIALRQSAYDELVVERDEDLVEASFGFVRSFTSGWQLTGRYFWSDNDSSLDRYSYSRDRTSLGFSRSF